MQIISYILLLLSPFLQGLLLSQIRIHSIFLNLIPAVLFFLILMKSKYILGFAFYAGLIMDMISMQPIGMTSLALILVGAILLYTSNRFAKDEPLILFIFFLFSLIVYSLIIGILMNSISHFSLFLNIKQYILVESLSSFLGFFIVLAVYIFTQKKRKNRIYV